jgi:hypothetical protein
MRAQGGFSWQGKVISRLVTALGDAANLHQYIVEQSAGTDAK